MTPKPNKFQHLFNGQKQTLQTEAEFFSELSDHQGEKGRLNESHLERMLSQYLPNKYALGTGFIVSSKSFQNETGPQLDIVIYDALNNSPLYQSEAFGIFPVEMVYGYIEVKTTLDRKNLLTALQANRRVRALKDDKAYLNIRTSINLAPRFYIFAYRTTFNKERLEEFVTDCFREVSDSHAHGIYILQHDFLLARKALGSADRLELEKWPSAAFPTFITNMIKQCDTMIPQISGLPATFALPQADMSRYFPSEPVEGQSS